MRPQKKQKHSATGKQRPSFNIEQTLANAIKNHQAGNLQQAEKIYKEILSKNPNHAETLHAQAIMACQRGQHAAAVPLFQKAIHEDSTKAAYHYNLGNALKDIGQFDEAVPCYEQALLLKPDYLEALNNLGTILHKQGKFDQAISSYQAALRIKPDHAETLYNLAITLQSANRLQDAVLCYQKALTAKEDFPEVYNRLGIIFHEQGKLDAAIGCFRQALCIDPTIVDFHVGLATALKDQGQLDEAITCYQKAIELAPGFAMAHNNMGNILQEKGHLPEAISSYALALQHFPDYAIAHGNLGDVLTQIGNLNGAIASCRKALEIDPNIPEVYMLLAALLSLTRDWEQFDKLVNAILTNQNLTEENRNWLYIQKALQAWLTGNFARCIEDLQASTSIQLQMPEDILGTSRLSYYCLLKKMTDYKTNSPHLYPAENHPPAYMIGDSHCLSFANLPMPIDDNKFTVVARLVMGGKAYHLSQKGHNRYKEALLRNINDIPDGSTVILSFGEIDCRTDEGIYPAWMKKFQHLPIEQMVREVVDGYLEFIAEATKGRQLRLMLLGVPAPMRGTCDHLPAENILTYVAIPRLWNEYLQNATIQNGWTFLDNYTLTCNEQGFSHGYYHIDARHLYPAALARLIAKHTITPHFTS
jgi:tetratricopeptide (TPR) repeat protein